MARPVTTLNRWEKISTKAWGVNSTVRFTKQADLDPGRVLRSLLINVVGSCTLATNPATAVLGDNVGAILEQIRMFGSHLKRGTTDNFLQMRGADLKEAINDYNGVAVFDNSAVRAVGIAAYLVDFNLLIDFPPARAQVREQVGYLMDVPNWSQLELDLQFGDEKSLWNLGTAVPTWTGQTVNILGRYAQEPGKFDGFGFGLIYRTFNEDTSSNLASNQANKNLYQLDNKGRIRSLLLKTGVKSLTTTAGNNAYASLSDSILSDIKLLQVPSQKFREFYRFNDIKAISGALKYLNPATGYALLDLTGDQLLFEMLRPSALATGEAKDTNLWLQASVVGAANQGLVVVQESAYYADRIVIPS
jgi:hypothetical protein